MIVFSIVQGGNRETSRGKLRLIDLSALPLAKEPTQDFAAVSFTLPRLILPKTTRERNTVSPITPTNQRDIEDNHKEASLVPSLHCCLVVLPVKGKA